MRVVNTEIEYEELVKKRKESSHRQSLASDVFIENNTIIDEDLEFEKEILNTLKGIGTKELFQGFFYNTKNKDPSFVRGKLKESIAAMVFSLGKSKSSITFGRSEVFERKIDRIIDDYIEKAEEKEQNKNNKYEMYEYIMFEVQMSLYCRIYEKINRSSKYYPSMAIDEIKKIPNRIERISKHVKNVTKSIIGDEYKEIIKMFPYISVYVDLKRNKIQIYDELLNVELPLNDKRYNRGLFKMLLNCINDNRLRYIEEELSNEKMYPSSFILSNYVIYGDEEKNNVHIHLNPSVLGEYVEFEPIIYKNDERKMFRVSGEEILSFEVILFELLSGRRSEDLEECRVFLSQEIEKEEFMSGVESAKLERQKAELRAYDMFLSTLNDDQRKMFEKEKITILEGDEYYYFATQLGFNYLIRFKKDQEELDIGNIDSFESLCLHQGSGVPFFDSLAAINLSLQAGEEDYINKKSNKFMINKKHFEKIRGFLDKLKESGLNFEGTRTLAALY